VGQVAVLVPRPSAGPRRRNAKATRAAILEAAKGQFARLGYDSATLREIAAAAGADVALINRYFGGKEGLFIEALKASINADRMRTAERATFAREIADLVAGDPHADEGRLQAFQFLLRAAASPTTAPLLNLAVQERYLGPIRDWLGGADALPRARVLAATFIGLLVERLIRDGPLEGRERDVFVARVAAAIEMLMEG
jgi:AcrR family transcriptional regulator